jgi:plasmid maintenance system antidote protein VapI
MEKLSNIHPGEVLLFELLNPLGISAGHPAAQMPDPSSSVNY